MGNRMREWITRGFKNAGRWMRDHKLRAMCLMVMLVLLWPRPARSQFLDPCCAIMAAGLSTISKTLTHIVGGGLNQILAVDQNLSNFERNVVWPVTLINQARALVASLGNTYHQIQTVTAQPVASATLPAPQQLEQNLLSGNSASIPNTTADYTAVYGAVPPSTESSPQMRNMVDMGDAVAQDAMKRAIEIDNLAKLELQAANQLNQAIQNAAPGSAPIIEAQADAWLVRANAYTQAATADLMRVRVVGLANQGENMKLGAAASSSMMQKLQDLLK
ncbi:MAG TPA: hypothetical protein VGX94_01395 [Terriglobia bacterium]|nr:hypothetical protein [Terriglobia bacterium]